LPGLVRNLTHRFEQWSLAFHRSGLTESASGLLLYTVAQVSRARVTGQPVLEATEGLIEVTRGAMARALGAALAGLRRERENQFAYAQHALAIARHVAAMLRPAEDDAVGVAAEDDTVARDRGFSLLFDFDAEVDDAMPSASPGTSRVLDAAAGAYRAFTTAHDVEVRAATLVRAALLAEYRDALDRRIVEQGLNVARLARQLQVLLAVPTRDGWDDDQDAGRIDGRRLAQLVVSPAERRLFRTERHVPVAHCVVAFLIDCSGSMKQHISAVTVLVDVFVRALEQAGVASELLGFTTGAWNGGRAARDWQRAGRPAHPGRLNEVCHLVLKDADTPWRRARRDIAALMKADLFREGIDGEAVEWACARLADRDEARRLLIVVSDGCPMDTATGLANDAHYLDQHLREVLRRQEQPGGVEIFGVGVGLDLSAFYSRSRALDLSTPPGNEACFEIVEMLAGRGRR
jgi:cobaltochelatase CobT